MRKELEIIEQIENYLMNKLSGADKTAFEASMDGNPNLKADVEFQQNLVEGIQRVGLKNDAIKARKNYRVNRILKGVGLTIAIIGAIVGAAYYYTVNTEGAWNFLGNSDPEPKEERAIVSEILIPENDALSGDANAYLDQELFVIKTDRDTVIESEEGIVVYIPAHAFDTENDRVDFLIQEALTPADILSAGLNTMTLEGEELETGGMFYFDAFAQGERIPLNKELTVDIPANPDKSGMQIYDGIKNDEGEILWTNPKPLIQPVMAVEITELDFYPRGYEPKMDEWGYLNKEFKDSLYYSFADECAEKNVTGLTLPEGLNPGVESETSDQMNSNDEDSEDDDTKAPELLAVNPIGIFMPLSPQDDAFAAAIEVVDTATSDMLLNEDIDPCRECGVNPASVKTIWNNKFNNTNLATKEFEARMPFIHQTCNNAILELYVRNLDKKLCTVDSMAMRMLGGNMRQVFANFAAKGHGQVQLTSKAQQKLNAYYELKKTALQDAIAITNANYWKEQDSLNAELSIKEREALNRANANSDYLEQKEVEFNTRKVYAQLGLKKPFPRANRPVTFSNAAALAMNNGIAEDYGPYSTPIRPLRPFLRANINSMGWKNIDCLMSVSMSRQDARIRGSNGRTATVNYSSMTLRVNNADSYDRINVYVVPTNFNSYVKLNSANGEYDYQLNAQLAYKAIAVAWNSEGMFYANIPAVPGISALPFISVTEAEWKDKIKTTLGSINNMTEELDYLLYAQKDQNRQNTNNSKRNLRNKARPFVFPCKCESAEPTVEIIEEGELLLNNANQSNITRPVADIEPSFKGGMRSMNVFISNNIRLPANLTTEETGTVYVQFTVNQNGKVLNPRITQGLSNRVNLEALRLVSIMPDWEPATVSGNPVATSFTLPINIRLE
jgi:hypothetical protein